jgi:hypothetical protein
VPTDEILLSINQGKKTTINLYKTKLEQHERSQYLGKQSSKQAL